MSGEVLQSFFEPIAGQISVIVVIILLLGVIMKLSSKKYSVSIMVKSAILIGVAFILNMVIIFRMPYGGSVTAFRMLVLFLIGYFFGARQGIIAGIAYGLLDFLMGPVAIHPAQILLDYPLAFGALGIGGLLRNKKNGLVLGYIVSVLGRYLITVLSGIIFWGMYAEEGFDPITWSFFYNMTYMLPEMVVTIVILFIPNVKVFFDRFKVKD